MITKTPSTRSKKSFKETASRFQKRLATVSLPPLFARVVEGSKVGDGGRVEGGVWKVGRMASTLGVNMVIRDLVLQNAAKLRISVTYLQKLIEIHGFYELKETVILKLKRVMIDYYEIK